MLIRFAVENFLSFKENTQFSMMAGKATRHSSHVAMCGNRRILKGSFLFGANASGKTNFIRAVAFARKIVLVGLENTNCDKKYFRLDGACRNRPGIFQFDLFSNGHFYSYGFAISYTAPAAIEEEWLYRLDGGESCVFLRSRDEKSGAPSLLSELQFKNKSQKSRFSVYKDDILNPRMNQTLFLTDVAMRAPEEETEYQPFRDVLAWFEQLVTIFPSSRYGRLSQLLDNDNEKARLENLLEYFDTGIHGVFKQEVELEKIFSMLPGQVADKLKTDVAKNLQKDGQSAFLQQNTSLLEIKNVNGALSAYEVVSNHGNSEDLFEYRDESDGTKRLFDLIPVYQKLLMGAVVLVDELDRSLHTKAAQEFIRYFYNLTAKAPSQLIVTTHDSNIMDLDFVRQDEIWFIERQEDHSSKLYSLNQFKARFDKKVEKEYLLGRYGAIPVFQQLALGKKGEEVRDGPPC